MTLQKSRTSTSGSYPGFAAPLGWPGSSSSSGPGLRSNSLISELPSYEALGNLLADYEPVDLVDLDRVALLNRVDTKYVLTHDRLLVAFASLSSHYRALDIDGRRVNRYHTLYF